MSQACSSDIRASKRRRIEVTANPFVDIEARVDSDSEDEEPVDVDQSGFIAHDIDPDSDDEDDVIHKDLLRRFETVPPLEEEWEIEMIERARKRARILMHRSTLGSSTESSSETVLSMVNDSNKRALEGGDPQAPILSLLTRADLPYLPRPEDKLWEILCEVGWEESIVHSLFKVQPPGLISAFSNPRCPGRIFLEMRNPLDVEHIVGAARRIRIQNARLVSPNLLLQMLEVLAVRKVSGWVRLRGNSKLTSIYVGDVAYLQECIKHFVLWVVPRFGEPIDSRPPRQPPHIVNTIPPPVLPKGVVVDQKGYWGFRCKDRRLYRHLTGVPSKSEAMMLARCVALPKDFVRSSIEKIRQLTLRVNDRVSIAEGTFQNLVGSIVEAVEDKFKVYIPSHDLEELLDPHYLRKEFRIGDQVEFQNDSQTEWGWIVQIWTGSLPGDGVASVLQHGTIQHHEIVLDELQFYEVPFSIAPRKHRCGRYDKTISRNFNKRYIRKTVKITRGHHKGKTGTILDAYEDGRCQVELDVFGYSQPVSLTLDDVCIAPPRLFKESAPPRNPTPPPPPVPSPEGDGTPWDPDFQPLAPGGWRDESPEENASPDAQHQAEMSWVLDPAIVPGISDHHIQLKLRNPEPNTPPSYTVLQIEDGEIVVRQGMLGRMKKPLECWVPIRPGPSRSKALCIAGEHIGKKFATVRAEGDTVFLRPEKAKYRKREVLVEIPLTSLVNIY